VKEVFRLTPCVRDTKAQRKHGIKMVFSFHFHYVLSKYFHLFHPRDPIIIFHFLYLFLLIAVVCKKNGTRYCIVPEEILDKNDWLLEGQHGFRPEYSCESQVITVSQVISESLDNGGRVDANIIDFSKAFDLVPHDRLLTKIAASGFDLSVVEWIREFLFGRTQRVRVEGQISEEVRIKSGVPQ
jgi:hypothetical protein